jgi:type II secretory pathway component PulF
MAIELKPAASAAPGQARQKRPIRFGAPRIGLEDRMIFTERLSLLLQTGVSLLEALVVMQQQTDQQALADVIGSLAESIKEGKNFSTALAGHPKMFSAPYVSLVGAAEAGGFLPEVLDQLLRMDEKSLQLRSNMVSTLSYPAFLIVFSILVVVFVLVVIFPKFEDLFSSIRNQLPPTTIILMAASTLIRGHWPILLGGLVLAVWTLSLWLKSTVGRVVLDRVMISTPVLGDLYIKTSLVRMLGVLGLSLSNGVPVTVALKACQGVVENSLFSGFIDSVRTHVNEGRGIAAGFQNTPFIPPMVRQMISTGEQTGKLGFVMSRIAEFYERDINKRIIVISKAIEPIMLLVMGVVVGVIVASLILPIFKLSRAVG